VNVTIHGLNQVTADLGTAGAKAVRLASLAVDKATADTLRDAQAFAPVDTGNLRNSGGRSKNGLSGVTYFTAAYARFVEEGTSRMAPHAFLGPAFDRNAGAFVTALEQIGRAAL